MGSDRDPDPGPDLDPPGSADGPPIVVPELRDYQQINAELVRRLNRGQRCVRLDGVEGQRLLALDLEGDWRAVVEIVGNAGPELAAGLNAPGVAVVCRGSAADGAGRSLRAGRLVVLGSSGTALGYGQEGGWIVAAGPTGPRAGLMQRGGVLVALGGAGPLAGERQSGGRLLLARGPDLRHVGRGNRGGRLVVFDPADPEHRGLDPDDRRALDEARDLLHRFGTPAEGLHA